MNIDTSPEAVAELAAFLPKLSVRYPDERICVDKTAATLGALLRDRDEIRARLEAQVAECREVHGEAMDDLRARLEEKQLQLDVVQANLVFKCEQLAAAQAEAEEARREMVSALALVARIREALGDNGKRMQDELIEHCKALVADSERLDWMEEHKRAFACTSDAVDYTVIVPCVRPGEPLNGTIRAAIDAAREAGR